MPWTIAHAAAVVPLQHWSRGRLSFPGLVVGSMAPDIPYYLLRFDLGTFAHTPAGTVLMCVPLGLLALLLVHALREPLVFMLPQPHRSAWSELLERRSPGPAILVLSVLLGAWTHIAWDACTHGTGWVVEQIAFLQQPFPGTSIGLYHGLQELSTVGGTVVLVVLYRRWLTSTTQEAPLVRGNGWRYFALAVCLSTAATLASILAWGDAATFNGVVALRVFLFRGALYGTVLFALLYAGIAVGASSRLARKRL